jgi:hypothetical protein
MYIIEKDSDEAVNMRSFVQPQASTTSMILAKQKCTFIIDADIIVDVIGCLLFDPSVELEEEADDVLTTQKRAMLVFVVNIDTQEATYKATITSALKLNLIIRLLSCGVSFVQAMKLYIGFKEETGMGVFGSINNVQEAQICRIICAVNLQHLKDIVEQYGPSQLDLMQVIVLALHTLMFVFVSISTEQSKIFAFWLSR